MVAAAVGLLVAGSAPAQAASCPTAPTYDPAVPTPESVLGFPLGIGQTRDVTSAEIVTYVQAVDAASDRVISFDAGETWGGRPLKVAIVSSREHMRPNELRRIRERFVAVREGRRESLRDSPALVWLAGNVHGGEKSGADAELKTLYELAARTDCAARKLNDDLVTVIMPSQNPDGREVSRRQNDYGFDLNRDWFARTQPETEAKVELLRRWPGQVFVDAHEMGGRQYFFPPNADPIHHEIADEPVSWINGIGEANKAAFGYNGACPPDDNNPATPAPTECYFNYSVYDLFFMGYGDTVPATGFGAAGMTYEKGSAVADRAARRPAVPHPLGDRQLGVAEPAPGARRLAAHLAPGRGGGRAGRPAAQRGRAADEHRAVPGARHPHPLVLPAARPPARRLAQARRAAAEDGRRGVPAQAVGAARAARACSAGAARATTASRPAPTGSRWTSRRSTGSRRRSARTRTSRSPTSTTSRRGATRCSWACRPSTPATACGRRRSASAGSRAASTAAVAARAPTSTRSTPRRPGALTFRLLDRGVTLRRDVERNVVSLSARSAPRSLDRLATELGIDVRKSGRRARGDRLPLRSLGVFAGTGISTTAGSYGETKYVIEQRWQRSATTLTAADVNTNSAAFTGLDALIVPDGTNATGGLDAAGQQNLRDWVAAGGVLVGLRRAHRIARTAGLTSTTEKVRPPGYLVLGSHFRVDVDDASPVALGRPREDFQFNNDDPLLNPSTTGVNVLTYPSDGRFWFNGYAQGADALKGTTALTDEPYGDGHVVLFANNPLFRAYEESGEHLVANAVLYPASGGPAAVAPGARSEQRRAQAQDPPRDLGGDWRPIRLSVSEAQSAAALAVVRQYAEPAAVERSGGNVTIVLANPDGLQADEHPFARDLLRALRDQGVSLRAAVL